MLKEAQSKTNLQVWLIVAACFTATIVMGETLHSLGVFFKPLEKELASSRTLVSSEYTIIMIGVAISSIVAGKLVDRLNPRPILLVCATLAGDRYDYEETSYYYVILNRFRIINYMYTTPKRCSGRFLCQNIAQPVNVCPLAVVLPFIKHPS